MLPDVAMTERTWPKVVLLILTWNRRDDVLRCAASLKRLTYPNYVPVVIDNASADDTVVALRARYPELTVIQNPTNYGYAAGNNVGIRWALECGAEYVQLINSDTEVTPDMITEVVRVAESDPLIGVVGCRNVLMDDPTRLWGAYGVLTYGPFLVRALGERVADGAAWQVVKDVDWVIGNGYLWRCAALERVGLLDESFFGYHEDVDWCVRAHRAGYRVVYAGTAAIVHKGGSSSDAGHQHSFPAMYFLGRNGVLFARKQARWQECVRFAVLCGGALAARLLRAWLLQFMAGSAPARTRWATAWRAERAFVRGIADALRRRPIPFAQLGLGGP
ncbi:MAG: glycosyltransferase family 2 protein [Candidatus Binatia bacterium]